MQAAFFSVSWAPIPVLLRDLGQVTPLLGPVAPSLQEKLRSPRPPSRDLGWGGPGGPDPSRFPTMSGVSVLCTLPAPLVLIRAEGGKAAFHIAPLGRTEGPGLGGDPKRQGSHHLCVCVWGGHTQALNNE